jgi:hypothetical protein
MMMPVFSPNTSANLGFMPLTGAYGVARSHVSPYGSGTPYASSAGYGALQGYTHDAESATAGPQQYSAESQPSPEEKSLSTLLTASGVPNATGRLHWPLGLRILAAPETPEMREQIDALFQETATRAASGPVNPPLIQEISRAIDKLRRLLLKDKVERLGMPLSVYSESERFLNQLEHAAQVLKPGLPVP